MKSLIKGILFSLAVAVSLPAIGQPAQKAGAGFQSSRGMAFLGLRQKSVAPIRAASLSPWLRFYKTPARAFVINPFGFPASGSFSPADVPGLQYWFKADALSLSNNDPVASWTDSSGHGNNAVQATTADKPLYINSGAYPIVRTDGVSDYLQMTFPGTVKTIFICLKCDSNSGASNIQILFGGPSNNGLKSWLYNGFGYGVGLQGSTNGVDHLWVNGTAATNDSGGNIPTGVPLVAAWDRSTDLLEGVDLRIGALGGTPFFGNYDIAELIGYDSQISTANRQAVEDYLGTKYGITISH